MHITPVFELEGAEMVKQAVAANLGISILWRCAIELDVAAGRLRFVPVEGLEMKRAIRLVRRRDHLSRAAQAFLEMIGSPAATVAAAASTTPAG